jgi:hypothetical protein
MTGNYDEAANAANHIALCMIGRSSFPQDLTPILSHEIAHGHSDIIHIKAESLVSSTVKDVMHQGLEILQEFYFCRSNKTEHKSTIKSIRWIAIFLQLLYISLASGSAIDVWMNVVLKDVHVGNNVYLDTLLSSLFCVPGAILCTIWIDHIGRRKIITWTIAMSGLSNLFAALISTTASNSSSEGISVMRTISLVILVCLNSASVSSAWIVLNVMISESFPTRIRSAAFAICAVAGRVAMIAAQYINGAWMNHVTNGASVILFISSIELLTGAILSMIVICTCYTHDMTHCPMREEDDNDNCCSFIAELAI